MKILALRLAACALAPMLMLPVAAHAAAPAPAAAPEQRMDHISVVATGKGSPVILIPGLSSPRAVWDGVVPALARTHRVYVVQVNGFGGDAPGANLSPGLLDGIVADLHALIVRDKLGRVSIVGHSMGGLVALKLARTHPGDAAALMVVDSLPFFSVLFAPPGVDPTVAMVAPTAAAMRDKLAAGYGKPVDPAAIAASTAGLALKPESIAKVKAWAAAADPRVTAQALYEDLTTDLRPALPAIATPVTLVYPWSEKSPPKPMVDAFYRKQYAALPHISYVAVGDAAHFVMLDQPATFATTLQGFADAP